MRVYIGICRSTYCVVKRYQEYVTSKQNRISKCTRCGQKKEYKSKIYKKTIPRFPADHTDFSPSIKWLIQGTHIYGLFCGKNKAQFKPLTWTSSDDGDGSIAIPGSSLFISEHNVSDLFLKSVMSIKMVNSNYSVPCGSIMFTTSDFPSGRPGSSPSRDHYSVGIDRGTGFIRALIPPG